MVTKASKPDDSSSPAAMSLRLDRSLYERLRKLAFDKRQPMSTFIVQGIELILKAENY